jgi:hypothetical protein
MFIQQQQQQQQQHFIQQNQFPPTIPFPQVASQLPLTIPPPVASAPSGVIAGQQNISQSQVASNPLQALLLSLAAAAGQQQPKQQATIPVPLTATTSDPPVVLPQMPQQPSPGLASWFSQLSQLQQAAAAGGTPSPFSNIPLLPSLPPFQPPVANPIVAAPAPIVAAPVVAAPVVAAPVVAAPVVAAPITLSTTPSVAASVPAPINAMFANPVGSVSNPMVPTPAVHAGSVEQKIHATWALQSTQPPNA